MAQHSFSPITYILVCALLIALTFLTLGVSFFPLGTGWHLFSGMTIGLCKASLVVLFFMHVLRSPRLTWIVIVVTVFWMLLFVGLTLTDYFSRGLVPFMPGH
jgi:caa(3)-type oxidase subunit IV